MNDLNVTFGASAVAIGLIANAVIGFLKYRNGDSGTKRDLEVIKKDHEGFASCFEVLKLSCIKQETLLEQAVQELRNISNKL